MKKRIFLFTLVIIFSTVYFIQPVLAADDVEYPAFIKFLRSILQKVDFTTGVTSEYETNIFLTEDAESSDFKNTLTQEVSLEIPEDPFYLKVDYLGNLSYYMGEGDHLHDHLASFLFAYRPYEDISVGISNNF